MVQAWLKTYSVQFVIRNPFLRLLSTKWNTKGPKMNNIFCWKKIPKNSKYPLSWYPVTLEINFTTLMGNSTSCWIQNILLIVKISSTFRVMNENITHLPPSLTLKMFFLRYFCLGKLKYLMVHLEIYQKVAMYQCMAKSSWFDHLHYIVFYSTKINLSTFWNLLFFFTKSWYLKKCWFFCWKNYKW